MAGAVALCGACGGAEFESEDGSADASVVGDAWNDSPSAHDDVTVPDAANDRSLHDVATDHGDGTSDDGANDAETHADAGSSDAAGKPDAPADASPCSTPFACVPAVPAGWSGPVELYAGSDPPPPCGARFAGPTFDGHDGLDAGAATCGCTCGAPQDAGCLSPTLSFQLSTTCKALGQPCASVTLSPDTCTLVDNTTKCANMIVDVSGPDAAPNSGSCPPMPTIAVPQISWTAAGRACAPTQPPDQGSCPTGSLCAPTPSSPFGRSLCIVQTGDVACPTTGYTAKQGFYASADDTRGCTACTCDAVTGVTCTGDVTTYSSTDQTCTGSPITHHLPFSCNPVQQRGDFQLTLTASGGACTPSTVAPTGVAMATQPLTFCCEP
jgi:hypothetical protein